MSTQLAPKHHWSFSCKSEDFDLARCIREAYAAGAQYGAVQCPNGQTVVFASTADEAEEDFDGHTDLRSALSAGGLAHMQAEQICYVGGRIFRRGASIPSTLILPSVSEPTKSLAVLHTWFSARAAAREKRTRCVVRGW